MITLEFESPPADLTAYISGYYLFRTDDICYQDIDRADIAQFRVPLEGDGDAHDANGLLTQNYPAMLRGPTTAAMPFELRGPATMFGVGLLPAGWVAFTGLAANKYVNTTMNAVDIFGAPLSERLPELLLLRSIADMAALMNDVWRGMSRDPSAIPHWFIRAVDSWLESDVSPDLAALEVATGLSRRQIERHSKAIYGCPPKLLARKYRALRTASAIAHGEGDWQDFVDAAYYDQSHCIREIKEFVGITPGAIRDDLSRLVALTLAPPPSMSRMPALSALR
ncbi:MAG: AraC family transcriptional regulator [Sphingomonadaceae bacterium]